MLMMRLASGSEGCLYSQTSFLANQAKFATEDYVFENLNLKDW